MRAVWAEWCVGRAHLTSFWGHWYTSGFIFAGFTFFMVNIYLCRMESLCRATYVNTYTLSNKNPSAWNFLSPETEVTCGTFAIIIRVVFLSPYLRIRAVSLSSIHYNQSHSVYRCPRRNGQNFGRVFLMLNYIDMTQNTYIQSWTVTEIMTIEKCGLLGCPRTVGLPWRHISPVCMLGNQTPLASIVMQWPWRDNASAAACVNYLET